MNSKSGILIVTGSFPPLRCGVGDYAANLAGALAAAGTPVYVYTSAAGAAARPEIHGVEFLGNTAGWGLIPILSGFNKFKSALAADAVGWVNIQYPTIGYGYSLGPQLLATLLHFFSDVRVVSTLHEFRHARLLRKLSLLPFLLFSDKLVFTAQEEAEAVREKLPLLFRRISSRYAVIPVGSNIPVNDSLQAGRRPGFVVFFGLFYPGRKLELVAEIFKAISDAGTGAVFGIIGDIHPKHAQYYKEIRQLFERLLPEEKLEWHIGESPESVAKLLASASAAVLPYPDGASFRRTTLMAALMSGVPAISTKGTDTPPEFREGLNILFSGDKKEFAKKALAVLSDPVLAGKLSANAKELSRAFSWESIAARYISFIRGQDAR